MKSEELLATSEVAAVLDSTAQLRSAKGWLCEIWSDQDTIVKVGAPGTTLR